jgi:hypothetical protein
MTVDDAYAVLGEGPSAAERDAHLDAAVGTIATKRASLLSHPRFLIGLAGALMTLGLCLIIVAWVGASHSIRTEEQIPYLISGGLAGVALAVIGAICLLAHWLTVLIGQTRDGQAELLVVLRRIADSLERDDRSARSTPASRTKRPLRSASPDK